MSNIDIKNGASVNRFYSDGSGELLAVFQYDGDAKSWAKMKLDEDAKNGMETTIVVASMYDGKSTMFCNKKETKE